MAFASSGFVPPPAYRTGDLSEENYIKFVDALIDRRGKLPPDLMEKFRKRLELEEERTR